MRTKAQVNSLFLMDFSARCEHVVQRRVFDIAGTEMTGGKYGPFCIDKGKARLAGVRSFSSSRAFDFSDPLISEVIPTSGMPSCSWAGSTARTGSLKLTLLPFPASPSAERAWRQCGRTHLADRTSPPGALFTAVLAHQNKRQPEQEMNEGEGFHALGRWDLVRRPLLD